MKLQSHIIEDALDPEFMRGYTALNSYFGQRNEMEAVDVLENRLAWGRETLNDDYQLYYEMVVLLDEQGALACTCDYSVVINKLANLPAIVHLSHILIEPPFLGKGIVGQHMNRLTIAAANTAKQLFNKPVDLPIILVGEMDHPYFNKNEETIRRINLFIHAGLKLVDLRSINYYQPDFGAPADIDAAGGAEGLPLALMLRRFGLEEETSISGSDLTHIIKSLYAMYGKTFREQDMAVVYKTLSAYPGATDLVPLLTEIPNARD